MFNLRPELCKLKVGAVDRGMAASAALLPYATVTPARVLHVLQAGAVTLLTLHVGKLRRLHGVYKAPFLAITRVMASQALRIKLLIFNL